MTTNLTQLSAKIRELELLAGEVMGLAEKLSKSDAAQPDLSIKSQRWYRGARAILLAADFSGIKEFDHCYDTSSGTGRRFYTDIEQYTNKGTNSSKAQLWSSPSQGEEHFGLFTELFQKARSLLISVVDELLARELPVKTELSFEVAASEFDAAKDLLVAGKGQEVFVRAAGVIARVALERHLLTVADARALPVQLNPPHKPKHDTNDILSTLQKGSVITPIQRSELETHFKIGNNCAHPKETVDEKHVERLIVRGRELSATIL
jgi:hypothetical protein